MISVCIATYNGAGYIKEQLESILSQLSPLDEVIISDDRSTDSTIEIINNFKDKRIKILHHDKQEITHKNASHIYTTANFENAIRHATGDYIFLSDQDDIWLPDRVKRMVMEMENADLVMCNFNLMDNNGIRTKTSYFPISPINKSIFKNLLNMPFFGSAMAFRRSLLGHILPFPHNLPVHDNWIGLIGIKYGKVSFIPQPLHDYRRHSKTVSHSITKKSENSLWYKLKYRLKLLYCYIIR